MKGKIKLPETEAFVELVKEYPECFSHTSGRFIRLSKWEEEGFAVYSFGTDISVNYKTDSDMFRALGVLMASNSKGELDIRQIPPFTFRGLMIDVSRNGVIKESYLKKIIIKLSLLGLNYLTLYTEDTYQVDGHPLVGYQRGKYLKEEIRRTVKFAKLFGIEMFPCIQTLGHVEQILKFPKYQDIMDDNRIFSVKKERTYKVVEDFIKNGSEPYESKIIHVGMDETWGLGKGKTFEINKKIDPRTMYLKHLQKVVKICKKHKLQPIMWADVIISMHGTGKMDKKQLKMIPKDVIMDFWDYYREDADFYKKYIKHYRNIGFEPLISPGIWNWSALWGLYDKAVKTMSLFLNAAKEMNVKQVLMTMWGDDGAECPFDSNWAGLAYYAEHAYNKEVKLDKVKKMVKAVSKDDWDSFVLPSRLDDIAKNHSNASKGFLYDDPLLGVFAGHAGNKRYNPYYEKFYRQSVIIRKKSSRENKELFDYAVALFDCLRSKADIKNIAYKAYKSKNKAMLRKVVKEVRKISVKTQVLWNAHRKIWLKERKPFGLEVMDLRYSGILGRLKIMDKRISDYLKGSICRIPELEEKPQNAYGTFPHFHVGYQRVNSISAIK